MLPLSEPPLRRSPIWGGAFILMNDLRPNHVVLPDADFRAAFHRQLRTVSVDEGKLFPWRASRDAYLVLLAEVLLQRTRGPNVARHFAAIIGQVPNATCLAHTPVDRIERAISALGLKKRARLLKRLGIELTERYDGSVPRRSDDLLKLPGVGPYSANAVRCFAYGERAAIVDAGIARVIRRCLNLPATRRVNEDRELWALAESLLPRRGVRRHNLALLAIADSYCRVEPRCDLCPLVQLCRYGRTRSPVGARRRRNTPSGLRAM